MIARHACPFGAAGSRRRRARAAPATAAVDRQHQPTAAARVNTCTLVFRGVETAAGAAAVSVGARLTSSPPPSAPPCARRSARLRGTHPPSTRRVRLVPRPLAVQSGRDRKGRVYAAGSSTRTWYSIASGPTIVQRSTIRTLSVAKLPIISDRPLAFWFATSTTAVFPSQRPRDSPIHNLTLSASGRRVSSRRIGATHDSAPAAARRSPAAAGFSSPSENHAARRPGGSGPADRCVRAATGRLHVFHLGLLRRRPRLIRHLAIDGIDTPARLPRAGRATAGVEQLVEPRSTRLGIGDVEGAGHLGVPPPLDVGLAVRGAAGRVRSSCQPPAVLPVRVRRTSSRCPPPGAPAAARRHSARVEFMSLSLVAARWYGYSFSCAKPWQWYSRRRACVSLRR